MDDIDRMGQLKIKLNSLQTRRSEVDNDQTSLTQKLAELKNINSADAKALKSQMLQRVESNEKVLVEITAEIYALQNEREKIEGRMQDIRQTLKYIRTC